MKTMTETNFELKDGGKTPANPSHAAQWWVERGGKGEVRASRTRYQRVWSYDLEQMDKALELVQGSFLAAAKLLDMDPQRFRNIVNYYPQLKSKWGRRRGRQPQLQVRLRFS
ncbi:MAG: hypothetical protein K0Q55_2383 [Verrucomicrobia bacterium]|jgi:hypothetical protein|nr:hypothetical protein [Verrucomicrobiota bacterium]